MSATIPHHILVPVDLSEPSAAGLRVANDLAHRFEGRLSIVLAENISAGVLSGGGYPPDELEAAVERHREDVRGEVEVFIHNTIGKDHGHDVEVVDAVFFADAILNRAVEKQVDWICMATSGRRGWRRLFLGSVTAEVVRQSPVPVLTFRDRSAEDVTYVFDDFRRVLVATDLGDGADELVQHGVHLAGQNGRLSIVHVLETPPEYGLYGVPLTIPAENLKSAREWTEGALEKLTKDIDRRILDENRILVGRATERILALEKELQPDVTVLGTHGRTGLNHLMLGSVAERIVRHVTGPVLVVPIGSQEVRESRARHWARETAKV